MNNFFTLTKRVTSLLVIGLVVLFGASTVQAAPASQPINSGQAFEIAPPLLPVKGDPGSTAKAEILLRNISKTDLFVTSEVNDFTADGEDGTPKLLLDTTEPNPYSLRPWVNIKTGFTLKSKELTKLPVTITIPKDAAPGGYYGVIRFSGRPPELEGTGVSLSASLGSLVFLTVNGAAKEDVAVSEFSVNNGGKAGTLFEAPPLNFVERFKNNGNIHEQPTGIVTITDMFGKTLATLTVNSPPRNILPRTIRKFEQKLDSTVIGNKFLFGHYTATFAGTYGASGQKLSASTDFWIIPYRLIAAIIVGLIIIFFVIRTLLRNYTRRILRNSRRRR